MTSVAEPEVSASATPGRVSHWIGGRPVAGTSGRQGPGLRPGHGRPHPARRPRLGRGAGGGRGDGQGGLPGLARDIAEQADRDHVPHPEPRRSASPRHRGALTAEHGKVPSDALGEIARGLENLEFACGVPNLLKGGFSEQASTGVDVYQIRQPLGVVAGITPFNFPAMVPMWMFGNALATGNTFILKPSEKDPSASVYLAELLAEAGRPGRRVQRRPRRQGRGRRHPRAPRHRRGQLRRLARPSPATSTRRAPGTASACRRWVAPRTT